MKKLSNQKTGNRKKFDKMNFQDKIRWRIRILWTVLAFMAAYMVIAGETGGGDSRIMTRLAGTVSRLIFFGGAVYVFRRIYYNKSLLKNRMLLKKQMQMEQDERNRYLHDKSGGMVMDVLLLFLLFLTTTAALYNMAAFYTSFTILSAAVILKMAAYLAYSHK